MNADPAVTAGHKISDAFFQLIGVLLRVGRVRLNKDIARRADHANGVELLEAVRLQHGEVIAHGGRISAGLLAH